MASEASARNRGVNALLEARYTLVHSTEITVTHAVPSQVDFSYSRSPGRVMALMNQAFASLPVDFCSTGPPGFYA